ncbi:polysaccharide export protein [Flavobacterium sp. CYK-4]|uniref:polysaccharide biosynthesis/export family protein n=1 Tax=Flavobacterium lotistagni TaxID=2709660 RepID=UPI00140E731B|nr:polysaccharide biosynthesis/export family protein [Flavobacterium lotistagni]NHM06420.1 polysaccharide export protein [Flavobacterium lotistagni]
MKLFTKSSYIFMVSLLLILSGCADKKKLVYLQGIDNQKNYDNSLRYEIKLQPDDLLSIVVTAENPEVTTPFNLPLIQGNVTTNSQTGRTFLIDNDGYIEYPVLGRIKLGGLTRTEATAKLTQMVSNYINNPVITVRIMNYKVSVLGEVAKPGSFNIPGERITVLEALSLAGDLTIYGKRKNILLIRDDEGKKTYTRIDLTDSQLLNSSNFYLAQNDILIVEPNKPKLNSSIVGPNIGLWLTSISVMLSLMIFLKNY